MRHDALDLQRSTPVPDCRGIQQESVSLLTHRLRLPAVLLPRTVEQIESAEREVNDIREPPLGIHQHRGIEPQGPSRSTHMIRRPSGVTTMSMTVDEIGPDDSRRSAVSPNERIVKRG